MAISRARLLPSLRIALLILVVAFQLTVFLIGPPDEHAIDEHDVPVSMMASGLLHPATAKEDFTLPRRHSMAAVDVGKNIRSMASNKTYHSPTFLRPEFQEIVKDHKNNIIVGDLQFLLDFAIIGYAKCGTSTMMEWLRGHSEVLCRPSELPLLTLGKIGLFAKNCYNLDETGDPAKFRAYKNPTDVQNLRAIRLLREYFPQTGLFVGIRHPIRWFESFYNHRIQNMGTMPPPQELKGRCNKGSGRGVCADRADFHLSLVRLGKTNFTQARDAFTDHEWKGVVKDDPPRSLNPLFLYDTQQLADKDESRALQFRQDVQQFIGLTSPLPKILHVSPGMELNATLQAERDALKMDICLEEHVDLRQILLEKGKRSAHYIRSHLMQAPDVSVSSSEYFLEILDSYQQDPCV